MTAGDSQLYLRTQISDICILFAKNATGLARRTDGDRPVLRSSAEFRAVTQLHHASPADPVYRLNHGRCSPMLNLWVS